jgi:hypothetical protein
MLRAISRNTVPPRETSVPITPRSPEQGVGGGRATN